MQYAMRYALNMLALPLCLQNSKFNDNTGHKLIHFKHKMKLTPVNKYMCV